jgi:hypothetical protein
MIRNFIVVGFATGAIALAIACSGGGNNSSSSSSGGSTTSSTGGTGTSSGSGTSSSSGAASGSGYKNCSKSTTPSTCDTKAYDDCTLTACDPTLKECFGDDYKNGNFGGPCSTWIGCYNKCACGDTACQTACGLPDSACTSCTLKLASCGQSCTKPACLSSSGGTSSGGTSSGGTSSGGASGTCAELTACCAKMTGSQQTTCNNAVTEANGNDALCGPLYNSLKSLCP